MEAKLEQVIAEHYGSNAKISEIKPLVGGACQENFVVRINVGETSTKAVVRGDSARSLPGSIRRAAEYRVVCAAVLGGVETPAARALIPDLLGEGRDGYLMAWADGVAIGAKVLRDPRLESARADLPDALARNLAAIHAITPDQADLSFDNPQNADGGDAVESALSFCDQMLAQLPVKRPPCALILRWLSANQPDAGSPVLVHGDYRTGNYLVTPSGLTAVLDWEFAHWGAREEDVAWACVRDWRFGALSRHAFGLTDRASWRILYEQHCGVALDPKVLHWWEVVGNLRWALGAAFQTERYLSGDVVDFELLAIGRRVPQMEFEALSLIEEGPC
jgi:aminoglycoside phosphotransferase (APT) family kinase protein